MMLRGSAAISGAAYLAASAGSRWLSRQTVLKAPNEPGHV